MTIYDKIKDEKLQYDINREAAKIDEYEYLTGEEILSNTKPNNKTSKIYIFSFRKGFAKTNREML